MHPDWSLHSPISATIEKETGPRAHECAFEQEGGFTPPRYVRPLHVLKRQSAKRRRNVRVIRELRPSLPAELPLSEQVRLVRGFSLWLRDEFGVAVHANIHAPRFLDRGVERRHDAGKLATDTARRSRLFSFSSSFMRAS